MYVQCFTDFNAKIVKQCLVSTGARAPLCFTRKYGRIRAGMRKKVKKTTFCSKSGEKFNSVKKTELDKGCSFHFCSSVQFLLLLKIASSGTDHSMSYFSDFYSVLTVQSCNLTS